MSDKYYIKFNYNLSIFSSVVMAFFLAIGFRSISPTFENIIALPKHFFQFDMYVYDMSSPLNSDKKSPEYYAIKNGHVYHIDPIKMSKLLPFGGLIEADRWSGEQRVFNAFFCGMGSELLPPSSEDKQLIIRAEYLINLKTMKKIEYEISC